VIVVVPALVAVPALIAAVLAGCAITGPTPDLAEAPASAAASARAAPPAAAPIATRLAVLVPAADGGVLAVFDGAARVATIPLPAPATSWISTDAAGRILATTADGRLFVAGPGTGGGSPGPPGAPGENGDSSAWRAVVLRHEGGDAGAPLSFATLSPDGRRLAALAADFEAGMAVDLVVADVDEESATTIRIPAGPDGAAPAWLPDGRLLLIARDPRRDATGIIVVDPARGGPAPRLEHEAYAIALSGDGRVAVIARPDGGVAIGSSSSLLGPLHADAGPDPSGEGPAQTADEATATITAPRAGTIPGSLALDQGGARLAVTWLDDAGGPGIVWCYRLGPGGAVAEHSIEVPGGAPVAIVAWLP
jgi:hypothetical protein